MICDLLFFILFYDCVLRSAPTTPPYCGFCTAVDSAPTDHHHPWILCCCDRGRSVTLWHLIPKKQVPATFQSHARITSQLSVCSRALSPILIVCAAALHRQRAHAPFTRLILDSARSRARPAESCTLPSLLPPFRSNPDFPRPPTIETRQPWIRTRPPPHARIPTHTLILVDRVPYSNSAPTMRMQKQYSPNS